MGGAGTVLGRGEEQTRRQEMGTPIPRGRWAPWAGPGGWPLMAGAAGPAARWVSGHPATSSFCLSDCIGPARGDAEWAGRWRRATHAGTGLRACMGLCALTSLSVLGCSGCWGQRESQRCQDTRFAAEPHANAWRTRLMPARDRLCRRQHPRRAAAPGGWGAGSSQEPPTVPVSAPNHRPHSLHHPELGHQCETPPGPRL